MRSVRVMKGLAAFSILASTSVNATTFEERVDIARTAFETEQGKVYEQKLGPFLGNAIRICIPPGSTSEENLGKFIFIAEVSNEGKITDSEIQPATKVSKCFNKEFATQILPPPPDSLIGIGGAPILVEMDIVP